MKFALVLLASAASVLANAADHHHGKRVNHAAINKVRRNETETLDKRDSFTGTATWYDVTTGAGACGDYMSPGDFVVALNSPQLQAYGGYQNGKPASCYQSITISYNGISQVATIKDECPTCGWGSLDLSQGLFSSFTSLDAGVFQMTWWFNGGSNSGGQQQQQQQQTTTQWVDPAPWTTNYTPPATTSTPAYVAPTTTTQAPPPPPPTTTAAPSTDGNTIQDVPTSSDPAPTNNVPKLNAAVVQLAQLINAVNPH